MQPSVSPNRPATALANTLSVIVDGLCRVIAVRGAKDRAVTPLMLLLWGRLRRLLTRFAALAPQSPKTLRPAEAAGAKPAPIARPVSDNPLPRLPRGFGWLIKLMPEANVFGSQLRHLLESPEMANLLRTTPRAKNLLRPLCTMLAIRPPAERFQPAEPMAPVAGEKPITHPPAQDAVSSPSMPPPTTTWNEPPAGGGFLPA